MGAKDKSSFIENDLRRCIAKGDFTCWHSLPSESLLARQYNVSRMTLRKALERLKRAGLIDSSRGAGSFVCAKPRDEIAIIGNADSLYSGQGFFFLKLLEEALRRVKESRFRPVIYLGHGLNGVEFDSSAKLFESACLDSCAGAISILSADYDVGDRLRKAGIPVVGHSMAIPILRNCVTLDYGAFIDKALEIFKGKGVTEFACFRWRFPDEHRVPGHMHHEIDRLIDGMAEKAKARMVYVPYSKDGSDAYTLFKSIWGNPTERPRHVFFADDAFCDFSCQAVSELGINVPGQVEFLTYANVGRKFSHPVPLTAIGFDLAEVVEAEWDILQKLIAGVLMPAEPVRLIKPQICHSMSAEKRSVCVYERERGACIA